MMHAVHAHDLFFLYRAPHGDVAALRGLSLEVAAGESVSVLGPSGAGKTTLLDLCAGWTRPSSGALNVLGVDLEHASQRRRAQLRRAGIGIVRQHYDRTLPRELTVQEIISLPLRLIGRPDRRRVTDLLRTAGLAARADAKPVELSGGEQQRVAVCAALARTPRLLLADEPTGELDARTSSTLVDLLLELCRRAHAAALIVTHDPAVADRTQRTIHMRDGRLAAEGTTRPVLIIDEQGWLRLPGRVRQQAGLRERVRAQPSWGKVELIADDLADPRPSTATLRTAAADKRYAAEIALDRVTKRFAHRDAPVVDNLSWIGAAEQFHVIAGPSGAGKTTLLHLLAALEHPDAGQVWVAGERVDSLGRDEAARWRQRSLGYLSQHSTLVEFLSAHENTALALTLRGFAQEEAAERAARWLEWVGLTRHAQRRADRLSGGEQRRVALARALAPGPRVLLADEPTAHLDRVTGRLVIRLLHDAAREGTTVVAASHDPDVISAADTRLALT
jgi:ABC-type lipoprotein export system ATPase subunit